MVPAKKKLWWLVGVAVGVALVAIIISACDNRNPVSASRAQTKKVSQIAMYFTPDEVVATRRNQVDTIDIGILVTDEKGIGIDSLTIDFSRSPNVGVITPITASESVPGLYQTSFITPPSTGSYTVRFTASVAGKSATDSITVRYQPTGVVAQISMNFDPSALVIRSPYKADTALINIWVRDANGAGIDSVNVSVTRSPNIGTIVPAAQTSGGFTQAKYITDPGVYVDVQITARAGDVSLTKTLPVTSQLRGEIGQMSISLQKNSLIAGGDDSSAVYVSVTDTTGIPIGDNTTIFLTNYGSSPHRGTLNRSTASTVNGIATFYITSPTTLDPTMVIEVDSLKAWGISLSGETTYAYGAVTYIPGSPATVRIITNPYDMVAGSGAQQNIDALVLDANGNCVVNGTQVYFRKVLQASNITSLSTTNQGVARAVYTVGTVAGLDLIRAYIPKGTGPETLWSQTVPLNVRSAVGSSISIVAANPTIELGGISTQIIATLKDENGNPLSDGYLVRFEITSAPDSVVPWAPSFNYVPVDSVTWVAYDSTDVSGRAAVPLFSGMRAGTVRIRATAVDNPNVTKEKTVVVITSGPPHVLRVSAVGNVQPQGEVLVGGITAMVWDRYTNPVEYNTAVHFSLIPDTMAFIIGNAYTGGYVFNPDSGTVETIGTPGLAQTYIFYACNLTFRTVRVVASSGAACDTSGPITLAFYSTNARLAVMADPGSIWIQNPNTWDTSDISAQLIDGIGCPVDGGIIHFAAQVAGELCGPTIDTTSNGGWAYTKFRIKYEMIPLNPNGQYQVTAKVVAVLRGYPDIKGETTIDCRHP